MPDFAGFVEEASQTRGANQDRRAAPGIRLTGAPRIILARVPYRKIAHPWERSIPTGLNAIISQRPKGLKRFTSGADPGRYVVEVDEDGIVTIRPAEPRRT